jgi:hypothetical protein
MSWIFKSLIIFILLFSSGKLFSQDSLNLEDRVYGLDQLLCNGIKYKFFTESTINGNQFLESAAYLPGDVTIKGKKFENLRLNYDIYNQQLLLRYSDQLGTITIIEISKAWLEGFHIGILSFECRNIDGVPRIYQVLGNGTFRILYDWNKKLEVELGKSNLAFSKAKRISNVLTNGKFNAYKNNRSFVSLFDQTHKPKIKSYIHKNRIRVRKASDKTMTELIDFIDNL